MIIQNLCINGKFEESLCDSSKHACMYIEHAYLYRVTIVNGMQSLHNLWILFLEVGLASMHSFLWVDTFWPKFMRKLGFLLSNFEISVCK